MKLYIKPFQLLFFHCHLRITIFISIHILLKRSYFMSPLLSINGVNDFFTTNTNIKQIKEHLKNKHYRILTTEPYENGTKIYFWSKYKTLYIEFNMLEDTIKTLSLCNHRISSGIPLENGYMEIKIEKRT